LSPEVLERVLKDVEIISDPNVLVGIETADDAAVYLLDRDQAIVQTVDFFTPIVDDAYVYGQIAAVNALSDIYAMGGKPLFALSVVGFPPDLVEESVLKEIIQGGTAKMNEAGVPIIGGHSVQDPEIKYGFCVTGMVHPDRILTNCAAQPGDYLILTKPIGTGIITTAIKFGKAPEQIAMKAIESMLQFNDRASRFFNQFQIHSVTDITGYGLVGHGYEMARGGDVTLEITAAKVPILEGTIALAQKNMFPGGIKSNKAYVGETVNWGTSESLVQNLFLDPQTSGGLLISLPGQDAEDLCKLLIYNDIVASIIGRVKSRGEYLLEII